MEKNWRAKRFTEPTPRAYVGQAQISRLEEDLKDAISDRDSERVYELSNELGITYAEQDPVFELYVEGQSWTQQKKEKKILSTWENLERQRKQKERALNELRSCNNSPLNDISFFIERNYPGMIGQNESIENYSGGEVFGLLKKIQARCEKQLKQIEKTSKEFYQRNEEILRDYV